MTGLAYTSLFRGRCFLQREVRILSLRSISLSPYMSGGKHKKNTTRQAGSGNSGKGSSDAKIISPSTIQVFSDPHLSQTVRDLAVSFQKSKNVIKNLREDLEDCTFELLRQGQNNDTMETAVKETTKLLRQCNGEEVPRLADNLKELQENVVYFSKLTANQENRLFDMDDNVQRALSELSKHNETLKNFQNELDKFRKENDIYRSEATAAFVETKIIKKELKTLKSEINSIKQKSK